MNDEPEFPDGASTWTQIRNAAAWLSDRLRQREAAGGGARKPRAPAARRWAMGHDDRRSIVSQRRADLQPTRQQGRGGIAFVGGGLDHWYGHAMRDAYNRYLTDNPNANAAYFTWDQKDELAKWLDDNAGHVTAIYGHSLGADTAMEQVAAGHGKGVRLFTIDPVGVTRPNMAAVLRNSGHWVNYNANHSLDTVSNLIARAGGAYGKLTDGYAIQVDMPYDHANIVLHTTPHPEWLTAWT